MIKANSETSILNSQMYFFKKEQDSQELLKQQLNKELFLSGYRGS